MAALFKFSLTGPLFSVPWVPSFDKTFDIGKISLSISIDALDGSRYFLSPWTVPFKSLYLSLVACLFWEALKLSFLFTFSTRFFKSISVISWGLILTNVGNPVSKL